MTELITRWNGWLNGIVWGPPMLILLMGTGLALTILTGAVQFRHLGTALREVLGKLTQRDRGAGTVTPFQAVATAWNGVTVPAPRSRWVSLPSTSRRAVPR